MLIKMKNLENRKILQSRIPEICPFLHWLILLTAYNIHVKSICMYHGPRHAPATIHLPYPTTHSFFCGEKGLTLICTKPHLCRYWVYCLTKLALSSMCHTSSDLISLGFTSGESTPPFFFSSWVSDLLLLMLAPELCRERWKGMYTVLYTCIC